MAGGERIPPGYPGPSQAEALPSEGYRSAVTAVLCYLSGKQVIIA